MLILPAVDIRNGKCVRLRQGRSDAETVFSDDPVAMARRWADQGAQYLHVVDLDGAFGGTPQNLPIVREIVRSVGCPVELGGGLRSDKDIDDALAAGVTRVIVGTRAATDLQWLKGITLRLPGKIAVGLDAWADLVALSGWTEASGFTTADFLKRIDPLDLAAVIFTDIARDGELAGPNLPALTEVVKNTRHPVIASGGVSTVSDIRAVAGLGCTGAIIGRALYEDTLSLPDALQAAR